MVYKIFLAQKENNVCGIYYEYITSGYFTGGPKTGDFVQQLEWVDK